MPYPSNAAELIEHGARAAHGAGYQFVADAPDKPSSVVPFLEIAQRALELSGALAAQGLGPGDRLAFIVPRLDHALGLLLACMRSGIVAIPLREPLTANERAGYAERVSRTVATLEARALVLTSRSEPLLREHPPALPMFLLETRGAEAVASAARIAPEDCAVILADVGSETELPPIQLSHAELIANLERAGAQLGLREDDRFVSWLPPFDQSGLTALLLPLYCQRSCALLPILQFLKRPTSWLETIHRTRATISFAPAHAYAFCSRRIEPSDLSGIELSSWRVAGAIDAPISEEIAGAFASRLAGTGFRREAFAPAAVIAAAPSGGVRFALSEGQKAIWFLGQLSPESTSYNVPMCLRLSSAYDPDLLRRALEAVLARHDVLRSVYPTREGEPYRALLPIEQALDFARVDAAGLDDAALQQRCLDEVERRFDLQRGPLLAARLFVRGPSDAALVIVVHHINVDGSSLMQLGAELWAFYEAYSRGVPPALGALEHSYDDFVRWQAALLASPEHTRLREYWSLQLSGAPRAIRLRADRPRPVRRSERGASIPVRISEASSASLREVARRHDTTLYTVLLAAFYVLLSRESGDEDIVVASPVAGRTAAAFHGLIGYFINTLPIRARITPELTFDGLVAQLRATVLAALDHQDLPYTRIVEDAQPQRDSSHLPLCQVMFQLHSFRPQQHLAEIARTYVSGARAKLGTLTATSVEMLRPIAQFELTLELNEFADRIAGVLTYASDRFDPASGQRLVNEYVAIADALARAPGAAITRPTGQPHSESDARSTTRRLAAHAEP